LFGDLLLLWASKRDEDLPVRAPAKYEIMLNLKSGMAIGLLSPRRSSLRADDLNNEQVHHSEIGNPIAVKAGVVTGRRGQPRRLCGGATPESCRPSQRPPCSHNLANRMISPTVLPANSKWRILVREVRHGRGHFGSI